MAPHAPETVYEEIRIPYGAEGSLFLRNKRPAGVEQFAADRVAVLLHGATYPGTSFDMAFGGLSWIDYMAGRGFDVYAPDLPGYGHSTRPAAMDQPPDANPPCLRREEAYAATAAIVNFVMQRRRVAQINLVGWCRGAKLLSFYAGQYPQAVRCLAMYAVRAGDPAKALSHEKIGAYRLVTHDSIRAHWRDDCRAENIDDATMERIFPEAHYDEWVRAIFATDPAGEGRHMRVPSGSWADEQDFLRGVLPKFPYGAGRVKAPTLLIRGEWDHQATQKMSELYYGYLANAAWKKLMVIKEATHFLFLEQNRMELYQAVQDFLESEIDMAPEV